MNCSRRSRSVVLLLLSTLVLVPAILAPDARAEDEVVLPIPLETIELLPVQEIEWAVLMHEHPELVTRLMLLGKRLERVYGHLKARANPEDSGSRMLLEQIQRLGVSIAPHLERLLEVLEPMGIDADVLSVLEDAPRGPLRLERHAVRLVQKVPALDARQRALHARLVPAVEGALLALDASKPREDADALSHRIQVRFWRVVDATLDRDQRIWLRRRLPTKVSKYADLFGHLYILPGLTPSQGARIKSLLVRLEQEAAPDNAIVARVEAALRDGALESTERHRLETEKQGADRRNVERAVHAWREGLTILTTEQRAELEAVPPLLTARDRPGDLEADLKAFDFTADQKPALVALHQKYGPVKGRLAQRMAALEIQAAGIGPDSPRQGEMEVLKAQAWSEAVHEAREAAREIFGDVLTPEQVLTWVIAAP